MTSFEDRFAVKFQSLGGLEPLFDRFNPVSPTELAEIERHLGVRLPESYREFLLQIGGARFGELVVVRMMQVSPGGGPDMRETFDHFFGGGPEKHLALLENIKLYGRRFSDKVIPIGDDLFGNLTCLGIKGKRLGKVYFWDHDYGKFYLAANSIEDFLSRLEIGPEPAEKAVPETKTLLETEWRHLNQLPRPGEERVRSLVSSIICPGNSEVVLERIKEVLNLVNIAARSSWPENWRDWHKFLPRWFLSKCTLEEAGLKRDPELIWLPLDSLNSWASERRGEMETPWPLADWVYWMAPERRDWYWWEGVVIDQKNLEIQMEIRNWPFPDGPLDWLARAAGAYRLLGDE
jgi:hypothetical protein